VQILQGYMNGEIIKLINNRYFDKTVEIFVKLRGE
jgi:hypothetical protein